MELLTNLLSTIGPTISNNLTLIGVYVILALGLNMINGMAGMFSLGHAGFWAIGAYASAVMTAHNPLGLDWYMAFAVGIVAAVALAAVAGLIIAVPCLRLAGDYLAIATLGFGIIIVTLLYNFEYVGAARGFTGIPVYASSLFVWLMVALTLLFYYRVQFSNLGRLIRALREDEIAAQAIGVHRVRLKTLVFVLGAGIAGLAGAMYASSATYLNPSGFEFDQSVKVLTMVVLGGLGSITGVTLAAIGLTILPEFLRLLNLADYQMLIFSAMLLVMVLMRPQGLLGKKELWDMRWFKKWWQPDGLRPESIAAARTAAQDSYKSVVAAAWEKGTNKLLATSGVGISFGGLRAVDKLSLHIEHGEIVGLIGPNGAGKTTAFNMITGVYKPTDGTVSLDGARIEGSPVHTITRRGIARTFQNIRLFRSLTVLDNVRAALHAEVEYNLLQAVLRTPKFKRTEAAIRDQALRLLAVFGLEERALDLAGDLPYGEQRKLEIVRALATKPKLLLLDEPAAGMNPQETKQLNDLIQRIRAEFKVTILLIEHDMSLVMKICERIYVLEYGRTIAHGDPPAIQNDQNVIKAYLGEE